MPALNKNCSKYEIIRIPMRKFADLKSALIKRECAVKEVMTRGSGYCIETVFVLKKKLESKYKKRTIPSVYFPFQGKEV
ncbi:hypothetical protein TNCT_373801 [Trichonephila clavata]|uniref:Uncharacterized protein n=1 Tax=Trichonephila clavata TaxID=2740835 RepID=A0A8X6I1C1_TRICU|nr:hypothetical protein TNCT_373801 [Trichonephila clavata]